MRCGSVGLLMVLKAAALFITLGLSFPPSSSLLSGLLLCNGLSRQARYVSLIHVASLHCNHKAICSIASNLLLTQKPSFARLMCNCSGNSVL